MEPTEISSFIDFVSGELYLFIAFLSGLYIGYIIGVKDNG